MGDEAEQEAAGPDRVESAEVLEELDLRTWDRRLGLFRVVVSQADFDDDDEPEADEDEDWEPDGSDDWDAAEWQAASEARDAARQEAYFAAEEVRRAAHPLRMLPIDDAIALARLRAHRVTVFLDDNEPWDASDPPWQGPHVAPRWPPPGLELRARWFYERADQEPEPAWWVRFDIHLARVVDPAVALQHVRELVGRADHVLRVRSVEPVPRAQWTRRGGVVPPDDDANVARIDAECLVAASADTSAADTASLEHALREGLPETVWHVPGPPPGMTGVWTDWGEHESIGISPRVLGPAEPGDLPASA